MTLNKLNQVVISVGSNINPLSNIKKSQNILSKEEKFIYSADIIETDPVGYLEQPNFLNTAFLVVTKDIEDRMGRERGLNKAGPRTIDLDIIVWNGRLLTDDYYSYDYVSIPVNQVIEFERIDIKI